MYEIKFFIKNSFLCHSNIRQKCPSGGAKEVAHYFSKYVVTYE